MIFMNISNLHNEPPARANLRSSIGGTATLDSSAEFGLPASKRPLTMGDYRTLVLAALGGALEFYDFVIFIFFAQALGQLFFPPEIPDWLRQFQIFGVFAVGNFVRPLGGIFIAHFGDLLGRKRMFTVSILMMAVATLGMGLLPVYAQLGVWAPIALIFLRVVQGAAVGGEVILAGSRSSASFCASKFSAIPSNDPWRSRIGAICMRTGTWYPCLWCN